jgi:predicted acylesterase/phospholipase RssA
MTRWKPRLYRRDSAEAPVPDLRSEAADILHHARVAELLLLSFCVFVWTHIGGSRGPLILGVLIAASVYLFLDLTVRRQLRSSTPGQAARCIAWLHWLGFLTALPTIVLLVLLGLRLFEFWSRLIFLAYVCWLVFDALRPGTSRRVTRLFVLSALVTGPVYIGWLSASVALTSLHDPDGTIRAWLDASPPSRRLCPEWTARGDTVRVAVMLSGGGYRAALTHAGVLTALDEQCVPIHLLSTVSGGSIVGATYALGVPPREFANRLIARPPGLPDSLLSIKSMFKSNSRIFREHLAHVYFGGRTLAHLPDVPFLLLNATDLYTRTTFARAIISKRSAPPSSPIRIADAVAASAAFPAAFGPIELRDATFLVDGGVVENLGLEGLRRHLRRKFWSEWDQTRPTLVVVADASGYAGMSDRWIVNPTADATLLRANAIQFDELHQLLYAELTGRDDLTFDIASLPTWKQYYKVEYPLRYLPEGRPPPGRTPETLLTVVIPTTAQPTAILLEGFSDCLGPGGKKATDVFAEVAAFSTLNELGPQQARQAFWLGYILGGLYGEAIECARLDLDGKPCTRSPRARPISC